MVRLTHLDLDDATALAAAFALGEARAIEPLDAGTINSNFRLETERGRYFLRVNEGKREDDVRYEAELVSALAAASVPTPPPLRAADGRPYAAHGGRLVSVFPWVEGRHIEAGEVDRASAVELGRALSTLHLAGAGLAARFGRPGIYTFADIVSRFEGFRDRGDPALAPAIAAIAEEIDWLSARAPLRRAAARGIIHGDLFRDNVLFDEQGGIAALLDFEQAAVGSLVYDLAVCLNAWCFTEDFDVDLVGALVGGYNEERPLAPVELEALYVEVRAAAMRFTVTRITDVYLPRRPIPGKDFARYLARLERWRALGEPGLRRWIGM